MKNNIFKMLRNSKKYNLLIFIIFVQMMKIRNIKNIKKYINVHEIIYLKSYVIFTYIVRIVTYIVLFS